jgi:hypothetical protein
MVHPSLAESTTPGAVAERTETRTDSKIGDIS